MCKVLPRTNPGSRLFGTSASTHSGEFKLIAYTFNVFSLDKLLFSLLRFKPTYKLLLPDFERGRFFGTRMESPSGLGVGDGSLLCNEFNDGNDPLLLYSGSKFSLLNTRILITAEKN